MRAHSIPIKYILLAGAVAAISAGCTSLPLNTELPRARSLGKEYKTIGRSPDATLADASDAGMATTDAVTLEQALALALMRSPELEAFSHVVLAAEARLIQAKLLPNPKVKVGASEFDRTGTGFDTSEIEVVLGQRLELGGKRGWRARVAEARGELAGWDYERKRLDVFTETTQRFTAVIASQRRVELAKSAVVLAEQTSRAVEERVKAGKEPPLQATKAAAELEMARLDALETETRLAVSRRKLAAMWGSEQPHFKEVVGDFDSVLDSLPSHETLRLQLSSNPDLARGDTELKLRQAELASEKAAQVPDLEASIGLQRFEEANKNLLSRTSGQHVSCAT
jgi:outer membrane protein, heavy metal efflux system